MTKYLLAVIAALTLALAGSGYALKRSYVANGAQKTKITGLEDTIKAQQAQDKRNRALIAKAAKETAAAKAEAVRKAAALDDALARNREWADQPVPQEVQDAME